MAPPYLPFDVLLLIADQIIEDEGERCFADLNSFLQVNSTLYDHLNPRLWRKAASRAETTRRVLTHLLNTRNIGRLKYFLELGADVETHLPDFDTGFKFEYPGPSPLIAAAYVDSVPMARLLLENGAMVEDEFPHISAIHAARSAEMVHLLLDHQADPEKNSDNWTRYKPLHWYAYRNNVAAMRVVLQRGGVDVQPESRRVHWESQPYYMPLHEAAQRSVEAVRLLLEFGADMKERNVQFETPLHFAVNAEKLDIVSLLVDRWPRGVRAENHDFDTPLHFAARTGNVDIAKLLVDRWPMGVRAENQDRNTPLHLAAKYGSTEVMRILLECWPEGAKATNRRSDTPLHFVARTGNIDIARLLVDRWPKGVRAANQDLDTPLHLVAESGRAEMMKFMLETLPEAAKARNQRSNAPLHLAAAEGRTAVVRNLLECWPMGVRAENRDYNTPLHLAAASGWVDVVQLLLEKWPEGAKARNEIFHTPLHLAAYAGRTEVLRLLLECWPEGVKAKDHRMSTPWHRAASWSWNLSTVRLLLQRWPEGLWQKDLYGDTPLDEATGMVRKVIEDWLEGKEATHQ
jgi:ankyrin repeat protein